MDLKSEIRELSAAETDQVAGGMIITSFAVAAARLALALKGAHGDPPADSPQGGQSDPAQMFQQIMQQMTQQG